MSIKKKIKKKKIKKDAEYQCQICGDARGKIYLENVKVEIQAHHIIPNRKAEKLL
jgi:predicted HNH restriction endonuclease